MCNSGLSTSTCWRWRCRHRALPVHAQNQALGLVRVQAQTDLLKIQNDVGNVLQHAVDGGKLMLHAGDFHRDKGRPLQGGQKDAPHGVADGGAVAPLQRLANKLAVRAAGRLFLTQNLVGLHELRPVARIDKAFALFNKHAPPAYFE